MTKTKKTAGWWIVSTAVLAACGPDSQKPGDGGGAEETDGTVATGRDAAPRDTGLPGDTGTSATDATPTVDSADASTAVTDASTDATTDAASTDATGRDGGTADATDADAARGDARATDATASGDGSADAGRDCSNPNRVVIATTDYSTGGFIVGDLFARNVMYARSGTGDAGLGGAPSDHVVRTAGCDVFDLDRTFGSGPDYVNVINPSSPFVALRTLTQQAVDDPSTDGGLQNPNPYDVALATGTKLYVVRYNSPDVRVYDPTNNFQFLRSISLAPLADSDGIPEASAVVVVGGHAFVTLQRLARPAYSTSNTSLVAVIDVATDMLVDVDAVTAGTQGITLAYRNPGQLALSPDGNTLAVASTGSYLDTTAGGVDLIDTRSYAVTHSIATAQLTDKPDGIAFASDATLWVSASANTTAADGGTGQTSTIQLVTVATGTVVPTPLRTSGTYAFGSLTRAPDGSIWSLGSQGSMNGRVDVLDNTTGATQIATPFIANGLVLTSIAFGP